MEIKFGTSGWRGIIADDFTFENVRLVTQAIANYIISKKQQQKGVIIGYDARFLSPAFARQSASVFGANGIKTFISPEPVPTPVLSYEVRRQKYAGAVNFTASHNPYEYNGLKFSPATGGPAMPEVTTKIEAEVKKLISGKTKIKYANFELLKSKKTAQYTDMHEPYLSRIEEIVDFKMIRKSGIKLIYDAMYGAGKGYMDELLRRNKINFKVIHNTKDAYFGGRPPEPAEENIPEMISEVKSGAFDIGLGTDGDADRFGIVDRDGSCINPNQVLCLLAVHLYRNKNMRGSLIRTIATTHMVDAIAQKLNLKLHITPVGFKYLGDIMTKEDVLICGEESGGLSILNHVPEKDGILACLLMAELAAYSGKSFKQLLNDAYKEFGAYLNGRINVHIDAKNKQKIQDKVFNFKNAKLAGKKIVDIDKSDGIKFFLSDGTWIMVRFSGTEPVVRLYVEVHKKKDMELYIKEGKKLLKV